MDLKISNLKLSLSCLLNNTYSLLDYIILSNEKSHFKKLIVKSNKISLRKIEFYLKSLFPNLVVTYSNKDLQNKEIKTDVRRLKYVLISIMSSFYYKKKGSEYQISPQFRNVSTTINILTDCSPIEANKSKN